MNASVVLEIAQSAILTAMLCALPLMGAALVSGLIVSVGMAATQINEATLTFVPKIVAVFGILLLTGMWILDQLVTFTTHLYERIPELVGPH